MLNAWITAPRIHTDVLWGLSYFFIFLALLYFGSVFYFRNKISKEAKKVRAKKMQLSPMISEFLFYDATGDKIEKINYIGLKIEIRELLKDKFDRKVLTEVMMDLRKDVSGNTQSELFHIYQDLNLHKDSYEKLLSWRWEVVSKGIFELTQMNVKDSYSLIVKFINNKRGTVRKQAEIATVTLKEEGISYFLDHTKYKISEWQQLKLLDVIRNKPDFLPPPFRLWLTSKNNHVVLFALRLIKYYNQNDARDSIIELVKHKNSQVKREAISCIKEFNFVEAIPVLKMVFRKCSSDVKMSILDAISELGTEEDIPFLSSVKTAERAFTIRSKAISALNTIAPETILPTEDIEPVENWDIMEPSIGEEQNTVEETIENETKITEEESIPQMEVDPVTVDLHENNEVSTSDAIEVTSVNDLEIIFENIDVNIPDTASVEENVINVPVNSISSLPLAATEIEDDNAAVISLNDLEVVFENIDFNTLDVDSIQKNSFDSTTADISFLPLVTNKMEAEFFSSEQEETPLQKVASVVQSPEEIEDIDWSIAFQKNESVEMVTVSTIEFMDKSIKVDSEEKPIVHKTKNLLPIAQFYEDSVLETMVLLEHISELGDHREIPYLKLLAEQESSLVIQDRIKTLIEKFTTNKNNNDGGHFEIEHLEMGYSVFNELMEKSDDESKLILLHEIAYVGDEKEFPLLKFMLSDENELIRKKAESVLASINKRLKEELEIINENTQGLKKTGELNLNFELNKPEAKTDKYSGSTLFDQLCAASTKLYTKLNG